LRYVAEQEDTFDCAHGDVRITLADALEDMAVRS
jgi:hypothetical protein